MEGKRHHIPVLVKEVIENLKINPKGTYIDLTFGSGGHSRTILNQLTIGKLIAFDQDQEVNKEAEKILQERFIFCQANFSFLKYFLDFYEIAKVDGILADLGVSSWQLDQSDRGFAIRLDGRLDMRMNKYQKKTAIEVINQYTQKELTQSLYEHAQIRNASGIAKEIIQQRSKKAITTTQELRSILMKLAPRHKEYKFLARVCQAIRIEVNEEMKSLKEMLQQVPKLLKTGGKLVVISYHSGEDRCVKKFMKIGSFTGSEMKDLYGNNLSPFSLLHNSPIIPTEAELESNPRARSAKLRTAIKIN